MGPRARSSGCTPCRRRAGVGSAAPARRARGPSGRARLPLPPARNRARPTRGDGAVRDARLAPHHAIRPLQALAAVGVLRQGHQPAAMTVTPSWSDPPRPGSRRSPWSSLGRTPPGSSCRWTPCRCTAAWTSAPPSPPPPSRPRCPTTCSICSTRGRTAPSRGSSSRRGPRSRTSRARPPRAAGRRDGALRASRRGRPRDPRAVPGRARRPRVGCGHRWRCTLSSWSSTRSPPPGWSRPTADGSSARWR